MRNQKSVHTVDVSCQIKNLIGIYCQSKYLQISHPIFGVFTFKTLIKPQGVLKRFMSELFHLFQSLFST